MSEQQDLIPQTEDDADALLESIIEPAHAEAEAPAAKTEEQAQPAIQGQDFAFTVGGKEIKLDLSKDREKLIRWAQQGYEAPNKIGELNKTLESYKSKEQQFKEWQEKYGPVDEYVRQNPQWWDHVRSQYDQLQQRQQADPHNPLIQKLMEKVEALEGVATTYQQQEAERQATRDDAAYMEEFQAVQKQYPKVDFSTPGPDGKSLEFKVLEYAQANGIKKFTTAFRDMYHDQILKMKEEEAKEKVMSDRQMKSKLGILNVSSTPTRKTSDTVKGKSYEDLYKESLTELGIA